MKKGIAKIMLKYLSMKKGTISMQISVIYSYSFVIFSSCKNLSKQLIKIQIKYNILLITMKISI